MGQFGERAGWMMIILISYFSSSKEKNTSVFTVLKPKASLYLDSDWSVELLSPFCTGQKNHQHPVASGFCLQWEWIQSAFTPGSNDSAVDTGFYRLIGSDGNVTPGWTFLLLLYFVSLDTDAALFFLTSDSNKSHAVSRRCLPEFSGVHDRKRIPLKKNKSQEWKQGNSGAVLFWRRNGLCLLWTLASATSSQEKGNIQRTYHWHLK